MNLLTKSRYPRDDEWGGDKKARCWCITGAKVHSDLIIFG